MCLRLSAARRSICKPCLARWSSRQHGCATPIVLKSCVRETLGFILQRVTVTRQSSLNTCRTLLFRRDERALLGESRSGQDFEIPDVLNDPEYGLSEVQKLGGYRHPSRRTSFTRRKADWCHSIEQEYRAAIRRQADRISHDLRRPSGDCDRKRAAVRRNPGQEPSARRSEPSSSTF